jgi:hypothetical protein
MAKLTDHPDFVFCCDPRFKDEERGEPVSVYVPHLADLVRRLGGMECIPDWMAGKDFPALDERREAMLVGRRATGLVVLAEVSRWGEGSPANYELEVARWYQGDCLSVHLETGKRWAEGTWTVIRVEHMDHWALTTELKRAVALECDRTIGKVLAFENCFAANEELRKRIVEAEKRQVEEFCARIDKTG